MSNMKELYYNMETAFEGLRKATMDCVEYEGKSLTEWNDLCDEATSKIQAQQLKQEHERKRQENIKNYRDQVDKLSRHDAIGQFIDLSGEFDRSEVHVDEDAQYRASMAFASSLQIDLED